MENASFCRNCGKQVNEGAAVCLNCGCQPNTGTAYCGNCGAELKPGQVVCLNCGVAINTASKPAGGTSPLNEPVKEIASGPKNAGLAALFSCLLSGLGQLYLGQVTKGIVLLGACFVLNFIAAILDSLTLGIFAILHFPLAVIFWVVVMLDAYFIGKRIERGETVGEWKFF